VSNDDESLELTAKGNETCARTGEAEDWDAESRLMERIRELKLVKSSAERLLKANQ